MSIKDLTMKIAYYKTKIEGGRIIANQTEILKMNLNKIELAYWLYHTINGEMGKKWQYMKKNGL